MQLVRRVKPAPDGRATDRAFAHPAARSVRARAVRPQTTTHHSLDERDVSYNQAYSRLTMPALVVAVLVATALLLLLGRPVVGYVPMAAAVPGAAEPPFAFAAFSLAFMKQYWFHFELATILLLAGIVAAWTAIREIP